ncbi:hypothetical protein OHS33_25880 [Streptomyces sp. NBC_00536]|uniref:hypothetical protein n=1 Tax=Streptomyces sp. NBC_00536 TaxID=2975769 RepID=UPI002E80EF51|nr:hypothetical protein [Streptomyces sp. NBC_00536]WUC81464.1 hypothetical protein OHS33_25880 [Streptomyces sp. NBC_00536]
MSRRTDNRHRAATLCREATGLPHHVCLRWAAEGLISRGQPVPDAESPAQRAFEARVALVLVYAMRAGARLGITAVRPTPSGLGIELHPDLSPGVFAALMPRVDPGSGDLEGVPGLRLEHRRDGLHLCCVASGGAIRILQSVPAWRQPLPRGRMVYVGRRVDIPLHSAERARLDDWADGPAARDWLLSRLLRRPLLVNAADVVLGWAHGRGYGHSDGQPYGYGDLVIEWCCDRGVAELEGRLRRSGLATAPPGIGPGDPPVPGVIALENARVVLRRIIRHECAAC